jgi:hypothetical protein
MKTPRMKSALLIFIVPLLLALPCCKRAPQAQEPTPAEIEAHAQRSLLAVPEHGIYTGAYADFGDKEDDVTLEKIEAFETMVGRHQAILASSSYWGEQTFPTANLKLIARHGAIPLVFWSPWDRPYKEGMGPDKYSLRSIIAGEHDAYIDHWGDAAKEHGAPILVSFCNEMNGAWFPWSGLHYGGGMSWIASARAARRTCSGFSTRWITRCRTMSGIWLRSTIPVRTMWIGWASASTATSL